jgi:uncharacterized membrane protein
MPWIVLMGLHALAATIWVGGMFFVLVALRPAAGVLEPAQRIALFAAALPRFLAWVWGAVAILLVTGYWVIFRLYGGFAATPVHVHVMQLTGGLMMVFFAVLWFGPFQRFRTAAAAGDGPTAAAALDRIRWIVATNLALGLLTSAIGAGGAYWT